MFKPYVKLALATLVILALSTVYMQPAPTVRASDDDLEAGILTVSGLGSVTTSPDTANISFGTLTQASSAREAQQSNAALMSSVVNALKQAGITETQMKTTGFSLEPVWDYSDMRDKGEAPRLVGYQVRNTIQIHTQRLDQVGQLIDVATRAGANTVNSLWFSLSDSTEARLNALEAAYQDAFAKAERLTKAAGITIIGVQSMDEGGNYSPAPDYYRSAMTDEAFQTPVLPGEQQINANITVKFIIK